MTGGGAAQASSGQNKAINQIRPQHKRRNRADFNTLGERIYIHTNSLVRRSTRTRDERPAAAKGPTVRPGRDVGGRFSGRRVDTQRPRGWGRAGGRVGAGTSAFASAPDRLDTLSRRSRPPPFKSPARGDLCQIERGRRSIARSVGRRRPPTESIGWLTRPIDWVIKSDAAKRTRAAIQFLYSIWKLVKALINQLESRVSLVVESCGRFVGCSCRMISS